MSKLIRGNQRHLNLDNRIYIEKCLDKMMAFKDIAKFLCKDPTTISKEVKKHRWYKPRNTFNLINNCLHKRVCKKKNKGKSFDGYSQNDITLMINHINSTARASLNAQTPFKLASLLLDQCLIRTLELKKIDPDQIHLKADLLKK